jgi:hypothetical protein
VAGELPRSIVVADVRGLQAAASTRTKREALEEKNIMAVLLGELAKIVCEKK